MAHPPHFLLFPPFQSIKIMRLVIQRVSRASVTIGTELRSSIGAGLMVLVGVAEGDNPDDAR